MANLEDLKAGARVRGLSPSGLAKVVQVEWFGDQAAKVTFEDARVTDWECAQHLVAADSGRGRQIRRRPGAG